MIFCVSQVKILHSTFSFTHPFVLVKQFLLFQMSIWIDKCDSKIVLCTKIKTERDCHFLSLGKG